jgi:hypothetical protein
MDARETNLELPTDILSSSRYVESQQQKASPMFEDIITSQSGDISLAIKRHNANRAFYLTATDHAGGSVGDFAPFATLFEAIDALALFLKDEYAESIYTS